MSHAPLLRRGRGVEMSTLPSPSEKFVAECIGELEQRRTVCAADATTIRIEQKESTILHTLYPCRTGEDGSNIRRTNFSNYITGDIIDARLQRPM